MLKLARTLRAEPIRQTTLARSVGISASAVSQAESGERPPREDVLEAWALALGVPTDSVVALYFLTQGLVPRDGDMCWYADLWSDEGHPGNSPHEFLGREMQAPLNDVMQSVAKASSESGEYETRIKVDEPQWEASADNPAEGYNPSFLGLAVTSTSFRRAGSRLEPHIGSAASVEVPEPRAVPNKRREKRIVSPGDQLASRIAELTPRQRELALAYIDGLLDQGT